MGIRVGTFNATALGSVEQARAWARTSAAAGFDALWFPQVMGLDALTTIDSRRIRIRSYAFMRMEAAALRGDIESEALWRERLSVSRRVANHPDDLEVARLLRL